MKDYPLPEELKELWFQYTAAIDARKDAVVHTYFKRQLRNAIYYGVVAEKLNRKFWSEVRKLYPEADGPLTLNTETLTVSTEKPKGA